MKNSKFSKVLKEGSYYNPANLHYGSEGTVSCDRCKREDISMCIGNSKNDLCMECVCTIEKELESKSSLKTTKEGSYKEHTRKKMKQRNYKKKTKSKSYKESTRKKMKQRNYKKKTKSKSKTK